MQLGPQRVSDSMLGKISIEIARLFASLNIEKSVDDLEFGRNYFEVNSAWLAACYSFRDQDPTAPIPVYEVLPLSEIPADRRTYTELYGGLEGFSASAITSAGAAPQRAVFLNADVNSPAEACHTLVHEIIHMHSHDTQGFQAHGFIGEWKSPPLEGGFDTPPHGVSDNFYTVLDEGATELFARVIRNHLRQAGNVIEVPRLKGIPVYEYPLAIVCDLAHDIGLKTIAKSFFLGDRALQNNLRAKSEAAGLNRRPRYSEQYFELISKLSINSSEYAPPQRTDFEQGETGDLYFHLAVSQYNNSISFHRRINTLGPSLPDPKKLIASLQARSFNDAALAVWRAQIADSRVAGPHPAVLALGVVAAAYTTYQFANRQNA